MTGDAIFNAYMAAETVGDEINRLVMAVPDAFAPQLRLSLKMDEGLDGDWNAAHLGYHFLIKGAVPRQRVAGQLLLAFDLCRPEESSTWPYGRSALLTCAYAPRYEAEGWSLTDILIGMDGRLTAKETAERFRRHADARLLEWESRAEDWNRRSWLYTVPLLKIDDRGALQREIVKPVVALLCEGKAPETALEGTAAARFAE